MWLRMWSRRGLGDKVRQAKSMIYSPIHVSIRSSYIDGKGD